MTADDRVLFEVDADRRIATITPANNPAQRNSWRSPRCATFRSSSSTPPPRIDDITGSKSG